MPFPAPRPERRSRCGSGSSRASPFKTRAAKKLKIRTRVENVSARPFPGEGIVRPAAGQAWCAAVRRARHAARAGLRARVVARNPETGRQHRRPYRDRRAENARQLSVEVRSGQRGHRLVREQRLTDHAEAARCEVRLNRPTFRSACSPTLISRRQASS